MTGFGRGRATARDHEVSCEIRAVNHRHCDVKLTLPPELGAQASMMERSLRARFARGRFEARVTVMGGPSEGQRPQLDLELAKAYRVEFERFSEALGSPVSFDARDLLALPGLIRMTTVEAPVEALGGALEQALAQALSNLERMRSDEGALLVAALRVHAEQIRDGMEQIRSRGPEVIRERKARLEARVSELLGGPGLDPDRIAQEIALLVDRLDVSEELERLGAHLTQLETFLVAREPVGRKIDFLLQEMGRETNTIGAKCSDATIAHVVVDMKAELERAREQAQNIE